MRPCRGEEGRWLALAVVGVSAMQVQVVRPAFAVGTCLHKFCDVPPVRVVGSGYSYSYDRGRRVFVGTSRVAVTGGAPGTVLQMVKWRDLSAAGGVPGGLCPGEVRESHGGGVAPRKGTRSLLCDRPVTRSGRCPRSGAGSLGNRGLPCIVKASEGGGCTHRR